MEIISRKEAEARGLKFFFTGKPCKHGHVSQRYCSSGVCAECSTMHNKIANSEGRYAETRKEWRERNIDTVSEQNRVRARLWHHNNKPRYRENNRRWANRNRDALRIYQQEWRDKNRDDVRAKRRAWKRGLKDNHLWSLKNRIGSLVRGSFKRRSLSKPSWTEEILGCSFEFFRQHIERQFLDGMTWDNRHLWHIDHIIPLATAETEDDVIALNHFTNLRPLWAEQNQEKKAKILFLI